MSPGLNLCIVYPLIGPAENPMQSPIGPPPSLNLVRTSYAGCQNYGPFLGPYYTRAPNI